MSKQKDELSFVIVFDVAEDLSADGG